MPECYSAAGASWVFEGPECPGLRLPTSAEWEYAARAGTTTAFWSGTITSSSCRDLDPSLDRVDWYCGNSAVTYDGCVDLSAVGGPGCAGVHPVGLKPANPWGFFDVHGNVGEFVNDWLDYGYYAVSPEADPLGPSSGQSHVVRGGSWNSYAIWCRSANWGGRFPAERPACACGGLRPAQTARPIGYAYIPAGSFMMGAPAGEPGRRADEYPQHSVTITRAFWLKRTEVTQGEWRDLMGTNPSYFSSCGGTCPVERVSWNDAVEYVNALSAREGLPRCYTGGPGSWAFAGLGCRGYRLPTEAEWEYAARAGTSSAFSFGDVTGPTGCATLNTGLDAAGWYCANSRVAYAGCWDLSRHGGPACAGTHPVATRAPNRWGLYDMHGNVLEWVHDWFGSYSSAAVTDPTGPSSDTSRAERGGSWRHDALTARSAFRYGILPDASGNNSLGFRPARAAEP